MKEINLEKLLYSISVLLVASGLTVRVLELSDNLLGLHLILSGLLVGLVAILMQMKRVHDLEQKETNMKKHLHRH